jgi:nitrite reductase (NAD(P)H)
MGVDVASFGDFFADKRPSVKAQSATSVNYWGDPSKASLAAEATTKIALQGTSPDDVLIDSPESTAAPRRRGARRTDESIKCLVYNDPFSSTYKKYIFTADGKHLLGGMMIGDVSDFVKLVALVKKKVSCPFNLSQLVSQLFSIYAETARCSTLPVHYRRSEGPRRERG